MQVCGRAGRCKALIDFPEEVAGVLAGAGIIAEVMKREPTFSSRFACEDAVSALMTRHFADSAGGGEELIPDGGTLKVRCKRYW